MLDEDGHPFVLCEELWDEDTRLALIEKVKPRRAGSRAPKGKRLLSGRIECGDCGTTHYLSGRPAQWRCTGRVRGLQVSAEGQPSPGMLVTKIDALVIAHVSIAVHVPEGHSPTFHGFTGNEGTFDLEDQVRRVI